jgi:hypothetical protein
MAAGKFKIALAGGLEGSCLVHANEAVHFGLPLADTSKTGFRNGE